MNERDMNLFLTAAQRAAVQRLLSHNINSARTYAQQHSMLCSLISGNVSHDKLQQCQH